MDTKEKNTMHLTGRRPRRKAEPSRPVKEENQISYTPAKPFNRNRFLLHLATVVAVVVAFFVVMSIFFKVDEEKILISGAEKYTLWDVKEATGIQDGDGLLGLSRAKISARIRARLPYVDTVRVGIKLPDTVYIEITERNVVYAVEDISGAWWLINTEGRIVDITDAAAAKDHTRIRGIKLQNDAAGQQAVAAPGTADPNAPAGYAPTADQCLAAALQVLVNLEKRGIMGIVDTVDVTDPSALSLLYAGRYEVYLGDTQRLDYKIAAMEAAIEKMGQYQRGRLDASFTVWPNDVHYQAFEEENG